ncbi:MULTISPECIES: 3-dehydroquinate synthase family protein [unclassified Treponema]|uniref:3-dehydroquinate synthase n=1 Tax=unclassified Treponema TaxID=2638727 RepID=UPI0020A42E42|nr:MULTISPECIES: 3-dehydroquinate synthase family protein [unclassified Treponema]UTC66633.1 3-dehydroquinate synthase [Treponema sp. OMZ 789]UTC69365.1 3-dehydroquinate synthase [Treponema sp. OMZ 790]UTC72080.1 3-dehydroquinate synthase [Treponema sp. OMZ 791]
MDSFSFTTVQGKTEVFYCDALFLPCVDSHGGMYIADSNTAPIAKSAKNFRSDLPLVIIEAGEENKNFTSLLLILKTALDAGLSRNSVFIGVGGGLVCDLAAFAASVYMRGAKCTLVPTSLLAMSDAAIGGKTAINFDGYKNMVGTFFKADEIYISTGVLKTLSKKEYLSGLAEIFKMGLLYSKDIYRAFALQKEKILKRDDALCLELVKKAIEAKAMVVSRDFDEKNERAFLNLGHSFGHALESVLNFSKISHGEAVAWGISKAMLIGRRLGLTDPAYADEVCSLIRSYSRMNQSVLPDADSIIEAMKKDKKNINGKIRLILQKNICETFAYEVSEKDIREVL